MIQRIADLSEPPIAGRMYLVPTVAHPWGWYAERPWPVFLPLHEDTRFFAFVEPHYHIDPRFIDRRSWERIAGSHADEARRRDLSASDSPWLAVQAKPLARHRRGPGDKPLAPVVWRRRRCQRVYVPYVVEHLRVREGMGVQGIRDHFAGAQAPRNRAGWVCPHQSAALGSIEPDDDGVITCPLHGLRVRAADGLCLGRAT
ncbi:MAG: hypothetical protein P4L73_19165 [Caulobacteraceae bacterium]|nr:hypothetical protein [Caulobacteraceae bacterium]